MSAFAGHGRAMQVDDDAFDADGGGGGNKSGLTTTTIMIKIMMMMLAIVMVMVVVVAIAVLMVMLPSLETLEVPIASAILSCERTSKLHTSRARNCHLLTRLLCSPACRHMCMFKLPIQDSSNSDTGDEL